jgi:hypothetical protein
MAVFRLCAGGETLVASKTYFNSLAQREAVTARWMETIDVARGIPLGFRYTSRVVQKL